MCLFHHGEARGTRHTFCAHTSRTPCNAAYFTCTVPAARTCGVARSTCCFTLQHGCYTTQAAKWPALLVVAFLPELLCGVAFSCHMLASFLAPLPAAPLPNCLHNCCFLLLAASGVLFASNLLPHFLLVPLRTMWSGPHSACMRVAACRRAPHAAWHVSENWRAIG